MGWLITVPNLYRERFQELGQDLPNSLFGCRANVVVQRWTISHQLLDDSGYIMVY
jgi:hypothetical protein